MGTRHLIAVQVDGKYRIAQYGQWDGYPEGQGTKVLNLLRTMDRQAFAERCRQLSFASEESIEDAWVEAGMKRGDELVSMEVCQRVEARYPELSRNTGAKILDLVATADRPLMLNDNIAFAGDSLFCEWAYVIDFDAGTFEVFQGFNQEPLNEGERFFSSPRKDGSEYAQVRLVAKFPLDDLPATEDFVNQCIAEEAEVED